LKGEGAGRKGIYLPSSLQPTLTGEEEKEGATRRLSSRKKRREDFSMSFANFRFTTSTNEWEEKRKEVGDVTIRKKGDNTGFVVPARKQRRRKKKKEGFGPPLPRSGERRERRSLFALRADATKKKGKKGKDRNI